jgi:hypothetical protein
LREVTSQGRLDSLGNYTFAFAAEEFVGDLLDALVNGFPILVPHVSREHLLTADPSQPAFELIISEAMERILVVDNSAEKGPLPAIKSFTDFCFVRKNFILDQRVKEAA